jgi:peptide/nickel transport system ATP-binding protein
MSKFLEVNDLRIHFATDDGLVKAVDGLTFALEQGRTLGIVGESGSGKSVTSLGILGLNRGQSVRTSGEVWLDGEELIGAPRDAVRKLRGRKMAMIFQDPLAAMHPFYSVGNQIVEAYRVHNNVSRREARRHAIDMLGRVGIPQPQRRVDDYPHQFSGGMRQRAMIAMALVCDPELLIADEPTTALDVTVQAQIMDLLKDLQQEFGTAIIFITHDLGVIAQMATYVVVMYLGRVMEEGPVDEIFHAPKHPYTRALLRSIPSLQTQTRTALPVIAGTLPHPFNRPPGCPFHPRCEDIRHGHCDKAVPALHALGPRRAVSCFLHSDATEPA